MPRRRGSYAETTAQKAQEAGWKYLVRNPEFINDLNELQHLYEKINRKINKTGKVFDRRLSRLWDDGVRRVADKYGLARLPPIFPNLRWMDLAVLESYGSEWGINYTPVMLGELKENGFLFFRVDVDHPIDDLLPLIEEQLRNFYRDRPKRRRRLDRIGFNCTVYDLAVEGKKFWEIATTLNKRVPTVKSAYLTARRNIFLIREPPTKKQLPLIDFDSNSHCQSCAICQKAQTFGDMCEKARLYSGKDSKAQRETVGHDTTEEIHRKVRNQDY